MTDETTKTTQNSIDYAVIIENLGEGLLIFDSDDKLILDNQTARQILGGNLPVIRQNGWSAFAMLVDNNPKQGETATEIRAKALRQTEPIQFSMLLGGAYYPCWVSAIHQENNKSLSLINIERADWSPVSELMENFRKEAIPAIDDSKGHANFIIQVATRRSEETTADQLAQRVIGFSELISSQMTRMQMFIHQLKRLEDIRTGALPAMIEASSKKINVMDFIEDFVEEITEELGKLPDMPNEDIRGRIKLDVDDGLYIQAAPQYFTYILRDMLHNALTYSKPATPIQIRAFAINQNQSVQIDMVDEGCGIRESEEDRIFAYFQRARQPQVIAEHGYGLSLPLAKANMEAMNGRIWFNSEESVGTTFSLKFPTPKSDD